jgi:hypothetical protein
VPRGTYSSTRCPFSPSIDYHNVWHRVGHVIQAQPTKVPHLRIPEARSSDSPSTCYIYDAKLPVTSASQDPSPRKHACRLQSFRAAGRTTMQTHVHDEISILIQAKLPASVSEALLQQSINNLYTHHRSCIYITSVATWATTTAATKLPFTVKQRSYQRTRCSSPSNNSIMPRKGKTREGQSHLRSRQATSVTESWIEMSIMEKEKNNRWLLAYHEILNSTTRHIQ